MFIPPFLLAMLAITTATARPHDHHGLHIVGSALHVAPDIYSGDSAVVAFPGFNNLLRNQSLQYNYPVSAADRTVFDSRCKKVTLGGRGRVGESTLEGSCADDSGQTWDTSLNLNRCIGNDAGRLIYYEMGNFDASCRPCYLDETKQGSYLLLRCTCVGEGGIPRYSSLQIGPNFGGPLGINAVDGGLVCGQSKGLKSPNL